jgi:hypothetical protein
MIFMNDYIAGEAFIINQYEWRLMSQENYLFDFTLHQVVEMRGGWK